jgi:hypothetical protein
MNSDVLHKKLLISKLRKWYVASSVLFFNTLLFIIVLAALICLAFRFFRQADPNLNEKFIRIRAEIVGLPLNEERLLTRETWENQWVYAPWVGFQERPRKGKHVNVSAEGFRYTAGNPDIGDLVLMFGGSTTFGYNVTDSQTIASYLQGEFNRAGRRVMLRNYGRGFYWSKQEIALLQMLLAAGLRPKAVIFLDGLNEFQTDPYYSGAMTLAFERIQQKYPWRALSDIGNFLGETAYYYSFRSVAARRYGNQISLTTPVEGNRQYLEQIEIAKTLCHKYQILPAFFLQPIPGFRNTFGRHALLRDHFTISVLENRIAGYKLLLPSLPPDIVDLSGLLEECKHQPFVDGVHYSPDAAKRIARIMFEHMNSQMGIGQL